MDPGMSRRLACFVPETSIQAPSSKRSPKDQISTGLGVLVTLVSQYINTPFLLAGCITYLVSHVADCTCPTCKPQFGIGPRGFAQRWCFVLPILCFAPYHLPEQLWRIAFPPPCEHNRCRLIRYMLPPQPWYHPLRHFYKPLQSQPPPPHKLFPFLKLPLELRNQIYLYASHANTTHTIQVASQWRAGKSEHYSHSHTASTTHLAEDDAYKPSANNRHANQNEDVVSYQLSDDGIVAVYGAPPPTNLLLVNKQVHAEARDFCWSTTAFEVQPLTPNSAYLWPAGCYETFAMSKFALDMRKVRVRIDVARFSMGREYMWPSARGVTFQEIEIEECLRRLLLLAKNLCMVLGTSVPSLRVVEIDWVDDFSEAVDATSLQTRAKVLVPFTSLVGVNIRLRKLMIAKKGREEVMTMIRQVLG